MSHTLFLIASYCTALLTTLLSTPLIISLAKKFGLVDDPGTRYHPANTHWGIIPRAGGVSILAGIVLSTLIFVSIDRQIGAILLSSLLIVAIGLWDDVVDLSPYVRFFLNIVVALLVVGAGIGAEFITNPLGGIIRLDQIVWQVTLFGYDMPILIVSVFFSVIWIVWMMNAVGWSAGVDGQFPGFITIASLIIAILSQRFAVLDTSQTSVIYMALITAGAYAGFLYWNFYPQKIMPGYGGKSLAGFLLAVFSIMSGAKVGTALLVLGVPLIDAFYTIARRVVQGKSPFKADRGHLHHRLLDLGWGKRRIAFFYWGITAVLGVVALTFQSPGKLFVFLLLFVGIGALLVSLRFIDFFRVRR